MHLFHVIFKVKGTAEIDLVGERDDVPIHRQDVEFELPWILYCIISLDGNESYLVDNNLPLHISLILLAI
jgi:hypothetical protein